jgi:polysaccharide pyruvyl transferase WcaK-like protein
MNLTKKLQNYYQRAYRMEHFPSLKEVIFSKKKKVMYCGFLGDGNYGDELVYASTKKLHSNLILIPIKKHMPLYLHAWLFLKWKNISGVVIGGGTLIKLRLENHELIIKLLKNGRPLFIHGAGATEFNRALEFWKTVLSFKTFGGVRGPLSVLNNKNNFNTKSIAIGDAAFALFHESIVENRNSSSKRIVVNYGVHVYNSDLNLSRNEIEIFLRNKIENGYEISFLPLHNIDIKLGIKLKRKIPEIILLDIPKNFKEAVSCLSDSCFAIGERLHFNIIALMSECPFVSINYDKKHEDFLISCKTSFAGFSIKDLSSSKIENVYNNKELLFNWNKIKEILNYYKKHQEKQANLYFEELNKR